MAISDNGTKNQYSSSGGQTVFTYSFEIFSKDDIAVEQDGVLLAEGTNYTVSGVGNDNGGNVTLLVGATSGDILTLYRNMALERITDYQQNGDFLANEVNDDFDRLWAANQQLETTANVGIRPAIDDTALNSTNTELADIPTRGGKALGFAADGTLTYLSSVIAGGDFTDVTTTAAMTALASPSVGDVVQTAEFATGNDGGATYDVVTTGTTPGVDLPNTFNIIIGVADPSISFVIRVDRRLTPEHLGVIGDGATDVTTGMQVYADFCIANKITFLLTSGKSGTSGEYKISSGITFAEPCDIDSIGRNRGKFLCVNTDCIDFNGATTTPSQISIRRILMAQAIRHTTTPNTFRGITFAGSTSSRPFWNKIDDVFIDGFGICLDWHWVWSCKVLNVNSVFCGEFINAVGICANDKIYKNDISGNGLAFDIGDGTNTCEGWHIDHNLIDGTSAGFVIDAVGCSYFKITNNIFDFMGAGAAVLMRSGTGLPSIGHDIKANYIAFNAAGTEGIRLLNSVTPAGTNQGSTVSDNIIFPYSGQTLVRGILIDGGSETNNTIRGNKISAFISDIDNSAATNSTITENKMFDAGFSTTANCIYTDNEGTVITSEVFLQRKVGKITEYFSVAIPVSGSFIVGDIVRKTAPTLNGNNMTLTGWMRLTTGSGHVSGTDWALMYISHVSPAT